MQTSLFLNNKQIMWKIYFTIYWSIVKCTFTVGDSRISDWSSSKWFSRTLLSELRSCMSATLELDSTFPVCSTDLFFRMPSWNNLRALSVEREWTVLYKHWNLFLASCVSTNFSFKPSGRQARALCPGCQTKSETK